jgi:Cu(I)/Ag(I) efflux system membrane fusion protein/cobalt-zinc-cadmium efflux system membrane fusion protein
MRFIPVFVAAFFLLIACGQESTPSPAETASAPESVELYTCGMHPNVVQEGPGTCPICGMDLTPVRAAAASEPPSASKTASGERKIKYWVAPMDPTYISDNPGKSPMGMDLVPVYEDEAPGASASGGVLIDSAVVQNMGVRVEPARRQTVFRHVRSIGEVEVGEDQISVVNLRFSGWVERIHVDKTGDPVERGQTLVEIYSPELVAAQGEYLLALRTQGAGSALARSARRKFKLWDVSDREIEAIAKSREVRRTLAIRSPRTGFVLQKNVVEGARVMAGQDLYQIGDLRRIWVTAEIYEFDAPWVEVGQPAQMELSHEEGKVYEGKVAYIYPTLNAVSRTLTVRLEFENPDIRLKPGMFATVYIQYRRVDDVLAIPTEAILDSGRRKIVFVSAGDGRFEPSEIVTGLVGDRHMTEVLSGIEEGEEIVVSGQYLLDSESQLQETIRKMLDRRAGRGEPEAQARPETLFSCPMHPKVTSAEPGRCPECGMDLEQRAGSPEELAQLYEERVHQHEHEHGDAMSETAAPGQYTCPMHPEIVSDEPGRCPVCGMFLEKATAAGEEQP